MVLAETGGSMGAGASTAVVPEEAGEEMGPGSGGLGMVVDTVEVVMGVLPGCWATAVATASIAAEQMMSEIFVRIDGA
jgi:hypothetical protein